MTDTPPTLADRLLQLYPVLADLPPTLLASVLAQETHVMQLPPGHDRCSTKASPACGFPMVLAGERARRAGRPGGRSRWSCTA
jgi:hypothetical protein